MASLDRPLQDGPMYGLKVMAAKLGVSVKNIMVHIKAGRMRYQNVGTKTRKIYRFTDYNLKTFIENQKIREVAECPSSSKVQTKSPKAHSTDLTSKSEVIAFSALPKPQTGKTPKP